MPRTSLVPSMVPSFSSIATFAPRASLLAFALVAACSSASSSSSDAPPPPPDEARVQGGFTTLEEIEAEMLRMDEAAQTAADDVPVTPEEEARVADLVDETDLLGPNDYVDEPESDPSMGDAPAAHAKGLDAPSSFAVDLRRFATTPKSQIGPRCSAYAGVGAMEIMLNQFHPTAGADLSESYAWSLYKYASCASFVGAATKNRIGDERFFPHDGKIQPGAKENAHALLAEQRVIGRDMEAMMGALDKGHVVYLGMRTPRAMTRCSEVIGPDASRTWRGAHALAIVGYARSERVRGGVIAILRNSWGPKCGAGGYHYVALGGLCRQSRYNCHMWEFSKVTTTISACPAAKSKPTSAWTCAPEKFGDCKCDCGCGEVDIDCKTGECAGCEHDVCTIGSALGGKCNSDGQGGACIAAICKADSYCCEHGWTASCIEHVENGDFGCVKKVCGK
jgi:hypothetical protein